VRPVAAGIAAKLDRAALHLESFREELQRFNKAHAGVIFGEIHKDGQTHVYRPTYVPDLPDDWSCIVGDCLHNMRTALDHLAWQLVIASGHQPTPSTSFPIRNAPGSADIFPFITDGMRAEVDAVQPYHVGKQANRQWLSILKQLDDIDKHRTLVVIVTVLGGLGVRGQRQGQVSLLRRRLKLGQPVARITYPSPEPEVDQNIYFSLDAAFAEPKVIQNHGVALALDSTLRTVRSVIGRFEQFVPGLPVP
jgi:hypothetical protein